MDQRTVVILLLLAAAVAIVAWIASRNRRTRHLRRHFGDEYERVAHERGSYTRAERELRGREKRVERLALRPLSP